MQPPGHVVLFAGRNDAFEHLNRQGMARVAAQPEGKRQVFHADDDPIHPGHRHQGIDIFGGNQPGLVPVYAASDGYLTRQVDWKSSLIIRVPEDPLQPDRQIWIYYTHLADQNGRSYITAEFPPGTTEKFIEAGQVLGYQGNYSGDPQNPVGVHLHFSIVKDDGQGKFLNELNIQNTLDPSPYLGLILNSHNASLELPVCH